MICSKSKLWEKICKDMEHRGRIGPALHLQCSVHGDSPRVLAQTAADFKQCPHGGCTRPCRAMKDCGHICKLVCHPLPHDMILCIEACQKPRPPNCSHKCKKLCWQDCGDCQVLVHKTRKFCGHVRPFQCGLDIDAQPCSAKCGTSLMCGHTCQDLCHPTGHNSLTYECKQPCTRTRMSCQHPCPKPCNESCGDCTVLVTRTLACGHSAKLPCHVDPDYYTCLALCGKELDCQHKCTEICHYKNLDTECSSKCPVLVKKTLLKCYHTPRHIVQTACFEDIDQRRCCEPCLKSLPCGHLCTGDCSSCLSIAGAFHKNCTALCNRILACNHFCGGRHACSLPCPPCDEECPWVCSHGPCGRNCSEPCEPCQGRCLYDCPHIKTDFMFCAELHSQPPSFFCQESCTKTLICGHPCLGLCGEVCPNVCPECMPEKYKKSLFTTTTGTEKPLFAEFSCGHAFNILFLDDYMQQFQKKECIDVENLFHEVNSGVPSCPTCGKTMCGVNRYASIVRTCIKSLEPEHLRREATKLREEVTSDLSNNNAGVAVVRLEKLLSKGKCNILLSLLMGHAKRSLGQLHEASLHYKQCLNYCKDNEIGTDDCKWEALHGLACSQIGGHCDESTVSSATIKDLQMAVDYLIEAQKVSHCGTQVEKELEIVNTALQKKIQKFENYQKVQAAAATTAAAAMAAMAALAEVGTTPENAKASVPEKVHRPHVMSKGSSLHLAACRGDLKEARALLSSADLYQQDDLGNTPLLCACENMHPKLIKLLFLQSPWHTMNAAKRTFLGIVLSQDSTSTSLFPFLPVDLVREIEEAATEALSSEKYWPSQRWAAAKHFDNIDCTPIDRLMDMIGLQSVKCKVLEIFHSFRTDLLRPAHARICLKQAMNFVFVGNPGNSSKICW